MNKIKGLSLVKPYKIEIKEFNLEDPKDNEVQIKTAFVGICGSDIAYFQGKEKYLGDDMWGHEGIGEVVKVGKKVKKFKVGDKGSSSWHPAFREYYNAPEDTCIKIPELSPKYILQCVSCPMNALLQVRQFLKAQKKKKVSVLLIGSGFTAYAFAQILPPKSFDVYGKYNKSYFSELANSVFSNKEDLARESYDVIINCDITLEPYEIVEKCLKVEGIFVHFATPREPFTAQFEDWNWRNFIVLFPSPRAKIYQKAVKKTFDLIKKGILRTDILYSKGYPFEKAQEAFDDFINRRKEGEFKHYLVF
jgi:threonine dehydrogenase-like Zn-dependent dehydrogenase